MADTRRPDKGSVKIYEHWQAGGVIGHSWDVFFGDGTHRAFEEERPARDAASRWSLAHHVSVWLTETQGTKWRLVTGPSSTSALSR